jgi:polar amino acid transport system substrate-binding protein
MRVRLVTASFLACSFALYGAKAEPPAPGLSPPVAVRWLTEPYPPFSFVGPAGAAGIAIDLQRESLAAAGLADAPPVFMPWARVLMELQSPEPSCVTAMTRTAKREAQYRWVGPFQPSDLAVAWRDRPRPHGGELPLAGLSVLVVRGDVAEEVAAQLGAEEARLTRVSGPDVALRMLHAGRVDAWVHGQAVMIWTAHSMAVPVPNFSHPVRSGHNYFACNAAVPESYLVRLQAGLDQLKHAVRGARSPYDRIVAQYLGTTDPASARPPASAKKAAAGGGD